MFSIREHDASKPRITVLSTVPVFAGWADLRPDNSSLVFADSPTQAPLILDPLLTSKELFF